MSANCRMCVSELWASVQRVFVHCKCVHTRCVHLLLLPFICMNFDEKRYVWQNISSFYLSSIRCNMLEIVGLIHIQIYVRCTCMLILNQVCISSRICTTLYCIVLKFQFPLALPNGMDDDDDDDGTKIKMPNAIWNETIYWTLHTDTDTHHCLLSLSIFPFFCSMLPYLYTICRSKWLQLLRNNWCMRFSPFTIRLPFICVTNVNRHTETWAHAMCIT